MQNKYDTEITLKDNSSLTYIIQSIKPKSTVLEFGPATGYMTKYLKEVLDCSVYIVEIDHEAYQCAVKYAVGGLCGNAENLEWVEQFRDIRFDYITFADVLEHLINPWRVLESATSLLKVDGGQVLVSLPNIAHNAILIDLYNGKFEYRKTGIMDNTHLRFFTRESALKLFHRCGLSIVKEDAVYFNLKYAGLDNSEWDVPENIWAELRLRKIGYVNQYLFTLEKEVKETVALPEHSILYESTVYFTKEENYLEEDKFCGSVSLSGNWFKAQYHFPKPIEVKKLIFELLPFGGVISDMQIDIEEAVDGIKEIDGFSCEGKSYYYLKKAKCELILKRMTVVENIQITGKIATIQVSELGQYLAETLDARNLEMDKIQQENGRLNLVINEKVSIIEDLQKQIGEKVSLYMEIDRLNNVINEKLDIIHQLQREIRERDSLHIEVDRLNNVVNEKLDIIHQLQRQITGEE